MGRSAANHRGNVSEFYIVWRVVTLLLVCRLCLTARKSAATKGVPCISSLVKKTPPPVNLPLPMKFMVAVVA